MIRRAALALAVAPTAVATGARGWPMPNRRALIPPSFKPCATGSPAAWPTAKGSICPIRKFSNWFRAHGRCRRRRAALGKPAAAPRPLWLAQAQAQSQNQDAWPPWRRETSRRWRQGGYGGRGGDPNGGGFGVRRNRGGNGNGQDRQFGGQRIAMVRQAGTARCSREQRAAACRRCRRRQRPSGPPPAARRRQLVMRDLTGSVSAVFDPGAKTARLKLVETDSHGVEGLRYLKAGEVYKRRLAAPWPVTATQAVLRKGQQTLHVDLTRGWNARPPSAPPIFSRGLQPRPRPSTPLAARKAQASGPTAIRTPLAASSAAVAGRAAKAVAVAATLWSQPRLCRRSRRQARARPAVPIRRWRQARPMAVWASAMRGPPALRLRSRRPRLRRPRRGPPL